MKVPNTMKGHAKKWNFLKTFENPTQAENQDQKKSPF